MQVSWIEAEDIKALLARIADPEPVMREPARPPASDWMPKPALIEAEENPFLIDDPAETVPDPFDAIADASSFVDAQPAVVSGRPDVAAFAPPAQEHMPEPEEPMDPLAAALPLSRIRDKLRAIRQRANEAGILAKTPETPPPAPAPKPASEPVVAPAPAPASASVPARPAFEPSGGSRQDRLAAFAAWARHSLREDGGHLLVMNDDGDLLWGGEAKSSLVLSAMMAWSANMRASALSACGTLPVMRQTLASGHMLTVIPCETAPGTLLHVAVAAPAALPDPVAVEFRNALILALDDARG